MMGYRSEVHLAVYTETKEEFISAFTAWRLQNGVDFTEWTMFSETETFEIGNPYDRGWTTAFGFIYMCEHVKWYGGYPEVQEVEETIKELPEFGFAVEFLRVGEESGDIETFDEAPENKTLIGLFWPETRISRMDDLSLSAKEHTLGDKSWIADFVENTSTIGDQQSDTPRV